MDPYGGATSSTAGSDLPGRIRKRRYSTARIQPTRIKKVMQSDEEIGRMIASVPVAVGSVMEHFTEKLLENAANIMHESVSKTLSPAHIFTAIQRIPYYSFLQPVVKNFGGAATASTASPVTTPTNGLASRPFENYASAPPISKAGIWNGKVELSEMPNPHLAMNSELYAHMRETAKAHLAANNAAAPATEETKRRRGRPRKDDKEKVKTLPAGKVRFLSPVVPHDPSATNPSLGVNGITSTADLDRVLMPPPLIVPQRKTLPSNSNAISSNAMISSSITSSSTTIQTSSNNNSMVNSSPSSSSSNDQPQKADAISA